MTLAPRLASPGLRASALMAPLLGVLAWHLWRVDFQLTDTFAVFARVQQSWPDYLRDVFTDAVEWRPLYYIATKLVHDAAGGPVLAVFNTLHLAALGVMCWAFYVATRPRQRADWFAYGIAVLALFSTQTSRVFFLVGPINGYPYLATLLLLSLAAIRGRIAVPRARWLFPAALAALFISEVGVLVPAAFALAWLVRLEGVERRHAVAAVSALPVYFLLRFLTSSAPTPPTFYNQTGFLFDLLGLDQQQAMFGSAPWKLYLYNLAATVGSLLFGEPEEGQLRLLRSILDGEFHAYRWLRVVIQTGSTVVVAAWVAQRVRRRDSDGLWASVVVSLMLLNCTLGYLYTRDRIITIAGVLLALLLYDATRPLIPERVAITNRRTVLAACLLGVALAGWSVRYLEAVYYLRDRAWTVKLDWERDGPEIYDNLGAMYQRPETVAQLQALPGSEALRRHFLERNRRRVLPPRGVYPRWLSPLIETRY